MDIKKGCIVTVKSTTDESGIHSMSFLGKSGNVELIDDNRIGVRFATAHLCGRNLLYWFDKEDLEINHA